MLAERQLPSEISNVRKIIDTTGPGVIGARWDQASEAKPMGAPERFPSPPPQNNRASISFARFSICKLIHLLIHFFFFLSLRLPVLHSLCPHHLIDEY